MSFSTDDNLRIALEQAQQRIKALEEETARLSSTATFFSEVIDLQADFICRYNTNFEIQYANSAYLQYFGKTREHLIGKSMLDWIPAHVRDSFLQDLRSLTPDHPMQSSVKKRAMPDNSCRWIRWTDTAIFDSSGQLVGYQSVGHDVTVEQTLQEELLRHSALLQQSHDLIAIADLNGHIIYMNDAGVRKCGYSSLEEVLMTHFQDYYADEDLPYLEKEILPLVKQGHWRGESRLKTRDGQLIPVDLTAFEIKQEDKPLYLAAIVRDITEQKLARQALLRSRERFSKIFEMLPLPTWIIQPDDERILDVNEVFLEEVGLDREDVVGRTADEFGLVRAALVLNGSPDVDGIVRNRELEYHTRSGDTRYGIFSAVSIELDGQSCILLTVQDVTEHRELRRREQRMSGYLRSVMQAGDELLSVQDDRLFERRAVEILREKLGVERCALFLSDPQGEYLQGTYGTGVGGEIVDEHEYRIPLQSVASFLQSDQPWVLSGDVELHYFEDGELKSLNRGWLASTLIRLGDQVVGMLSNDAGLTHTPIDVTKQEAIAVYASLLGNILQRREVEKELRTSHHLLVESSNALMELVQDDPTELYVDGEQIILKDLRSEEPTIQKTTGALLTPVHAVKIHQALRWQSDFLRILLMLSSRFINVPVDRLDEEIAHALGEIGTFLRMDRVYIFDYDFERYIAINTYEWCAEGIEPQIMDLQDTPLDGLDDWLAYHRVGKVMHIPDVQSLDPELVIYQILAPQGIQSILTIPLMDGDNCIGFIGLDAVREQHFFGEAERQLLFVVSQLLVNVRNRIKTLDELRTSEAQFRQLIETMQGGVAILGLEDNLTYANDRFCEMFGYRREELLSTGVHLLFDAEQMNRIYAQSELRKQQQNSTYELIATHREGYPVHLLVNGSPMYDRNGVLIGSFSVSIDISVQKAAEAALRRALEQEKELGQLKSQFVSTTSHEFRTPLATILATTETLLHFRNRLDDEQVDIRLNKIRGQVQHLRQIMDDILQLARIQARRMEFNPALANLAELCEEVVEEFNNGTEYRNRVRYEGNSDKIEMVYDPRLMRQVINNLISNALKYSPAETMVEMRLLLDADTVIMEVQDFGIGIPARSLPHIFEPFHRADNVGTIQGTGLGLPIVKEAVEVHHGTIEIQSEVQKGSLITVRLPLNEKYNFEALAEASESDF